MFAFILETLGSFELLFILAIALIFFGPRKLPQLARSFGKGLAEFRKASDDFKRTWEREVAMESARLESQDHQIVDPEAADAFVETQPPDDSIEVATPEEAGAFVETQPPDDSIEVATPEEAVARETTPPADSLPATPENIAEHNDTPDKLAKHDWL